MTISNHKKKKVYKYLLISLLLIFAAIGLFLSLAFIAIKLKLTNDGGSVDFNNRYYSSYSKYNMVKNDSIQNDLLKQKIIAKTLIINNYQPKNAELILKALSFASPLSDIDKMVDAVVIQLGSDSDFLQQIDEAVSNLAVSEGSLNESVFKWMNISEWIDFKYAVAKDKLLIDSVALETGVESRLIVAILVGEQIRLFNSKREAYKKWIGPLKILSVESSFSYGVTGIKEETAELVEKNLIDTTSVFYLGAKYEKLLDFRTPNRQYERFQRLTSYKNHRYSYVYAALILRQLKHQWEVAGYPIDNRPEILATLFNVGFNLSKPKPNPQVGGATIKIYDNEYTFGSVAYQFYYSGELINLFPYNQIKFKE